MQPGQELDRLIAEKVMGLIPQFLEADYDHDMDCYRPDLIKAGDEWVPHAPEYKSQGKWFVKTDEWETLPHYSEDLSAAWDVVQKIKALGYWFQLINFSTGESCAEFHSNETIGECPIPRWEYSATEDTPAHAICMAALRVVGAG